MIGRDPFGDLAVLQITDNFSDEKLLPLPIVNSSNCTGGRATHSYRESIWSKRKYDDRYS